MEYLDAIFQYFGYDNFHEFAFWVAKNPYEFLVSVMIVLTPMFIISGILAFYLLKAIEKDEKEKKKREKRLQNIKQDQDQGDKPKEKKKSKNNATRKGKKSQKAD
ncbi:Small integral membrane protein 15 [Trichoplax sp. H2]|nr:Small integral membrane protein 15 [Trichoplax sp. H2]|eukprot:RDD45060.1 Small integral membrane protein 15 [Trichoplax sp. H2]